MYALETFPLPLVVTLLFEVSLIFINSTVPFVTSLSEVVIERTPNACVAPTI